MYTLPRYIIDKGSHLTYLNWYPFLISQGWPDMMWLSDSGLVGFKEHFCSVSIHVQGTKDEDQTRERRVWRDGL